MRTSLKIILIIVLSIILIFLLTKFAISFLDQKSSQTERTFTVKKSGTLSNIIFLSLVSDDSEESKLPPKINFLLLGAPGQGNSAPNLTDTIMLATLKPQDKKIYFFSIPRDLYARIGESQNFSKINSLYELGKIKNPASPAEYIIKTVEIVTNEKIDYFLTLDLVAIKKIVDDLGGLNVNVSETVNDPQFPTANNSYETFRIDKGWRYFDGETTLKYLRTRHSLNGDFDRMRRQQDIVEAFRKKIFGLNIIWDFPKILKIYSDLEKHITTNIDIRETKPIYKTLKTILPENLTYKVINSSDTNNLVITTNIPLGNGIIASIVEPNNGLENYEEIQKFVKKTLNE